MKTTRSQLEKIASVPCLYKHAGNGSYYGLKKVAGKKLSKALKTDDGKTPVTSLQEAKVKLAGWLASLSGVITPTAAVGLPYQHPTSIYQQGINSAALRMMEGTATPAENERYNAWLDTEHNVETFKLEQEHKVKETAKDNPTLAACFERFYTYKTSNTEGTINKYKAVKRAFELYNGNELLNTPVNKITPMILATFLGQLPTTWKPQYFNTFELVVNQVFEMARMDRSIKENPLSMLPKEIKKRKVNGTRDLVPTIEQCEQIAASIRKQSAADTREVSANLCELIHRAAIGQAEAVALTWSDIDFENEVIRCTRVKTNTPFDIPFYHCLQPFLVALADKHPNRKPTDKLFNIVNIKKAIYGACERLNLPSYSPRDLRKARITWLLRKGYPVELIADAQGHKDGGVLIRRVYSNVIDESKAAYKKEMLAKLAE